MQDGGRSSKSIAGNETNLNNRTSEYLGDVEAELFTFNGSINDAKISLHANAVSKNK